MQQFNLSTDFGGQQTPNAYPFPNNNIQLPSSAVYKGNVFAVPHQTSDISQMDDHHLSTTTTKKRKAEEDESESRRDSHNIAEKRRRDKINEKIDELSVLISNNPNKSNKASILGSAVEHISALESRYQELLERNRLLKIENAQLKQAHAKFISSLQGYPDGSGLGITGQENPGDHDPMFLQYHQMQQNPESDGGQLNNEGPDGQSQDHSNYSHGYSQNFQHGSFSNFPRGSFPPNFPHGSFPPSHNFAQISPFQHPQQQQFILQQQLYQQQLFEQQQLMLQQQQGEHSTELQQGDQQGESTELHYQQYQQGEINQQGDQQGDNQNGSQGINQHGTEQYQQHYQGEIHRVDQTGQPEQLGQLHNIYDTNSGEQSQEVAQTTQ